MNQGEVYANVAAWLEGEGSIQVSQQKYKGKSYYYLNITISNQDKAAMEHIKESMGIGTIYETKTGMYVWYVYEDDCYELLKNLLPYMRHNSKIKQAKLAIQYFEDPNKKKEDYFYGMRFLKTQLASQFFNQPQETINERK